MTLDPLTFEKMSFLLVISATEKNEFLFRFLKDILENLCSILYVPLFQSISTLS